MKYKAIIVITMLICSAYSYHSAYLKLNLAKGSEELLKKSSDYDLIEEKINRKYKQIMDTKILSAPDFYKIIEETKELISFLTVLKVESYLVDTKTDGTTTQKVIFSLLHEGQVIDIAHKLNSSNRGLSYIDQCHIKWVRDKYLKNKVNEEVFTTMVLNMECLIKWETQINL